jgi:hypothetical protein
MRHILWAGAVLVLVVFVIAAADVFPAARSVPQGLRWHYWKDDALLSHPIPSDSLAAMDLKKAQEDLRAKLAAVPQPPDVPLPRDAVTVWTYEGGWMCSDMGMNRSRPISVEIGDDLVGVDYGLSGVLFDRKTGAVARRLTLADGWPDNRPSGFPSPPSRRREAHLVGPGVIETIGSEDDGKDIAVAVAEFSGRTWKAYQPATALYPQGRAFWGKEQTWTEILREDNAKSYLEATGRDLAKPARYTTAQGLPGNLVTHLAVAGGTLWASCVDIFDPEKKDWGEGGLARYDAKADRWERIKDVDGRPVRWVTILRAVGDDLWIGFREGEGVVGDKIVRGMGIYPEQYRPDAKRLVLGRLAGGKWTTWARDLAPEVPPRLWSSEPKDPRPPTEVPRRIEIIGDKVFLLSVKEWLMPGNWDVEPEQCLWLLDAAGGRWRSFDVEKDLDANEIIGLEVGRGEAFAVTERGLHRWSADGKWTFMDTGSTIQNPTIQVAAAVGKDLWIAYNVQSFGVNGTQGISRYEESAGRWSWFSPKDIGTACPVESMAVLPSGDVYVNFGRRFWGGSAAEFPFYPREDWRAPTGVARYSAGKWEFPAKLDGIPEKVQAQAKNWDGKMTTWDAEVYTQHLEAVGDRLFILGSAGIFMGPGKWKKIADADRNTPWSSTTVIRAGPDEKSLLVFRSENEVGRYDIAADKITFEKLDQDEYQRRRSEAGLNALVEHAEVKPWRSRPHDAFGSWGFEGTGYYPPDTVETPAAIWLISPGRVIRLDREKLIKAGGPLKE